MTQMNAAISMKYYFHYYHHCSYRHSQLIAAVSHPLS